MSSHRRRRGFVCSASLAAVLLAGCAVTPRELRPEEMSAIAGANLSSVTADQEPLSGRVDLYEALARALKYNLDHQVELAQHAVRERELDLSHYSLLPGLVAGSGYAGRDSFNASNSVNVITGQQSLATSTSQDKRLRTGDIAFSWNILDFGLSYVRARQAADKALIQNELRRKVTLRIIEETRAAYWRAASAQRLLGRLARVEKLARDVEREARTVASDGETSAVSALTYQREVVEIQRTIGEISRELVAAKALLAALMNIAPGTAYTLADSQHTIPAPPRGAMTDLLHFAVMNRPELKEVEYQKRINEHEAHAALLELLPGLNLIAGNNFDSNSFLLTNHWVNWGAKASWNLIKVFSYPAHREVIEAQDRMLATRSLSLTMAVMTQVYVSRIRYAHAVKEHAIAVRLCNVQRMLLSQIRSEHAAGRITRHALVREELNAVVAEARLDVQFAAVQAAYANMQASIGIEPFDEEGAAGLGVKELARALRGAKGGIRLAAMEAHH